MSFYYYTIIYFNFFFTCCFVWIIISQGLFITLGCFQNPLLVAEADDDSFTKSYLHPFSHGAFFRTKIIPQKTQPKPAQEWLLNGYFCLSWDGVYNSQQRLCDNPFRFYLGFGKYPWYSYNKQRGVFLLEGINCMNWISFLNWILKRCKL